MKERKIFILDFDGTFYSGENVFSLVNEHVDKHRRKFFPCLTDGEYERVINENPDFKGVYNGLDIANYLFELKNKYKDLKILPKHFYDWQNSYPDPIVLDGADIIDFRLIEELCNTYAVYVVSNSSLNHLKLYMKQMNINAKWFKKLIGNKFTLKDRTKKHYYKWILDNEKCKPSEVYVVGDSERSDLAPARELGMNCYYVPAASQAEEVLKKLIK